MEYGIKSGFESFKGSNRCRAKAIQANIDKMAIHTGFNFKD